jgi:hypothetical protein
MQHNVFTLIDKIEFAKQNFEHTLDAEVRCRFFREEGTDEDGREFRKDTARFGNVLIVSVLQGVRVKMSITGEDDDVRRQLNEIDAVILTYESCKPGLPASDRRNVQK